MKLKHKFLIPAITLIMVGMAISTLVSYTVLKNALEEHSKAELLLIADSTLKHLSAWLEIIRAEIARLSEREYFKVAVRDTFMGQAARKTASAYLKSEHAQRDFYASLNVADERGNVVASSDEAPGTILNVVEQPYFQEAMQGNARV